MPDSHTVHLPPSSSRDVGSSDHHHFHSSEHVRSWKTTMSDSMSSLWESVKAWRENKKGNPTRWRRILGITLLLATVVLWTVSNFLASTIFADNTYSKPYFVTYVNTAFFIIPLTPLMLKYRHEERGQAKSWKSLMSKRLGRYTLVSDEDRDEAEPMYKTISQEPQRSQREGSPSSQMVLEDPVAESDELSGSIGSIVNDGLTIAETAKLSVEFCIPWFLANYFAAACLEYTTVASATILTSTSSIWTLLLGAVVGVERFTLKKLLGVLASLAGIVLISSVDMSGQDDENRGSFPQKSPREIMIGDSMAFISAVLYGLYAILMKKRIGDETRVNMPLFFGFIGLFNVLALWPGFIILHFAGVETFELPPTGMVLTIVLVNSLSSLVSDFCWAWSMLLTSPLVITVGLSLTIPLSLIGQMVIDSQYSSFVYWVGAGIVFLSFVFVNHEESKDDEDPDTASIEP